MTLPSPLVKYAGMFLFWREAFNTVGEKSIRGGGVLSTSPHFIQIPEWPLAEGSVPLKPRKFPPRAKITDTKLVGNTGQIKTKSVTQQPQRRDQDITSRVTSALIPDPRQLLPQSLPPGAAGSPGHAAPSHSRPIAGKDPRETGETSSREKTLKTIYKQSCLTPGPTWIPSKYYHSGHVMLKTNKEAELACSSSSYFPSPSLPKHRKHRRVLLVMSATDLGDAESSFLQCPYKNEYGLVQHTHIHTHITHTFHKRLLILNTGKRFLLCFKMLTITHSIKDRIPSNRQMC